MKKITIKKAIEFDKRTDRGKQSMIRRLQQTKLAKSDGGGDYWVRSLSAITKACKENDHNIISEKIKQIELDHKTNTRKQTRDMYDRNVRILRNFENFDFDILKPNADLLFQGGLRLNSIISTQGIPLQVVPSVVFTYKKNDVQKVGATLFIAKLEKYNEVELALICEALYRNLRANYSKDFKVDRSYCSVVDVLNVTILKHQDLNNRLVSKKLNFILKEIRTLL